MDNVAGLVIIGLTSISMIATAIWAVGQIKATNQVLSTSLENLNAELGRLRQWAKELEKRVSENERDIVRLKERRNNRNEG